LNDVLTRYCEATDRLKADYVVRITADNPFAEPRFIDKCVNKILLGAFDYVTIKNVPYGSNAEVVTKEALFRVAKIAGKIEKEHVTLGILNSPDKFKIEFLKPKKELQRPDIRLTLDTLEDYEKLQIIFEHFKDVPTGELKLESVIKMIDSDTSGVYR